MKSRLFLVATVVTVAVILSGGAVSAGKRPAPTSGAAAVSGPCGSMSVASTHYQHVIWVWMENHSYSAIIGASAAPYINSLASECGLATNYHNISHPSLPNYIGATSGLSETAVQAFNSDCSPSSSCDTPSGSIFSQATSWRAYEESMPSNCAGSDSGPYAVRHNPPPYYTTLGGCSSFDVPYSMFAADLADNSLPAFSFVTPNVIDDMHDGSVAQGDSWLAANLPGIFASSAYKSGTVVVFVTWDEGEGGSSTNCPANRTDVGCHVATLVISPSTKAGKSSGALYSHYSLLRTTEELLHLPLLGQAAHARSMMGPFKL